MYQVIVTVLCYYMQSNKCSVMVLWNLQPLPCSSHETYVSWSNFQCNVNTALIINIMNPIFHYLYLYMQLQVSLFSLRFS